MSKSTVVSVVHILVEHNGLKKHLHCGCGSGLPFRYCFRGCHVSELINFISHEIKFGAGTILPLRHCLIGESSMIAF